MSSNLHDKMFNYKVTPPAEVWGKIAAELDDAGSGKQFPSRLANLEISPPISAWGKIQAALDVESKAPAPVVKMLPPLFRYAAAAVIISFLAWGGFQLFNKKTGNNEVAVKETSSTIKNNTGVLPVEEDTNNIAGKSTPSLPENTVNEEQEARDNAALEKSKGTYASLGLSTRSKLKNVSNFYFNSDASLITSTSGLDNDQDPGDITDRYIMLMTPDGNIIRVSKKLSDLVCCVSGEEQDKNCLDQLKKWQEKMANSSIGHSSGNFMDIFNLVSTLQSNED